MSSENVHLQQTAKALIVARAKTQLRALQLPGVAPAVLSHLDAIVDQLTRSLTIMHEYREELILARGSENAFLIEQLQDLLESLLKASPSLHGGDPVTR